MGRPVEPEIVKLGPRVGWREFYEQRLRAYGKVRPGCGGEKIQPERRMLSKRSGTCRVCRGPIYPGDWIYWNPYQGKARHAPSGHAK